ncbi:MAG TPA: N-acetyltransferase [Mobilitalea sp.]|nr:N-acetyltransferase [Mobilitalea sp.]
MKDIYEDCPVYRREYLTLIQTDMEDAVDLLKCYSDENAVPIFNSDNCHGDNFHYTTIERMRQAIDFWSFSYTNKYFIRWTVRLNSSNERIGTVEMFHRLAEDEFNHYGVLRIDLQSSYETASVIGEILEIANSYLYEAFQVEAILTKAIPGAKERITALMDKGYQTLNKKLMVYDDYYVRYNGQN